MDYTTLKTSLRNNVLTIELYRPDVFNAVNETMKKELLTAFRQAAKDPGTRCIVIRGSGEKAFCSGQDLKEYQEMKSSMKEMLEQGYNPIITAMRTIEKPIIAMINGVAAGAGFSIALACDMRIMSQKAKLIQAFVRIGLVADSGGHWLLPRIVGMARAFEYAVTGRDIDAVEAERVGLVNSVAAPEDLEKVTYTLAEKLAQGPTKAIGIIKRTMNKAMESNFDELLSYEAFMQETAAHTADHKEGVAAFLEKRPAQFSGM